MYILVGLSSRQRFLKPKAISMEENTDNLDFIKIKNFYSIKNIVKSMKRQDTDWEKIFANYMFDKGHVIQNI